MGSFTAISSARQSAERAAKTRRLLLATTGALLVSTLILAILSSGAQRKHAGRGTSIHKEAVTPHEKVR
jgi:hypothetical protein